MKQTPLDAAGFAAATGASAQQVERLAAYLELLGRWQARINLVGASTLADAWRRHVLDSSQLVPLLPATARNLVDLGSGAGFPGLVIAILTDVPVTLVESDARKAAFLAEAARQTASRVSISIGRAESLAPRPADVVTARALAPLPQLLQYAVKWLAPNGVCLFPKGRSVTAELTEAGRSWKMRTALLPSQTDSEAMILQIDEILRRA